ncbi:MAG: hypothetical protein CO040_02205 [Candidatus Pacebacteria bacterium CG_4_9_14_0_2_um_filter_36_8]|nr:MAG: hypothetical protein CO040_02205 [Candidatus Pacebacteria bacterium CG_4_9_14_0_2_um_filter_36_8]
MKKLLVITPSFYPQIGGVERHVWETSNLIKKAGWQVSILTEQKPQAKKIALVADKKIQVFRFSYPKIKYLGLLLIWWQILHNYFKLIKTADIIHVHDVFIWYLPFKLMFWRKPVVVTFHGWEGKFPLPQKNILWRQLGVRLANKTIAIGSYLEKYYHFKADKILYGGVHIPKVLPKKTDLLLYVGRLEFDTGLPMLLQALKNNTWDGKVVFCGDGVLREQAEQVGEVVGFSNPEHLLTKAKIVFAGGYLSILEAFAYQCAVIAVYGNSLKKDYFLMSPLGHLISLVKNDLEVTKKIQFLENNPKQLQTNISKSLLFAKTQTWENISNVYLNYYSELLKN